MIERDTTHSSQLVPQGHSALQFESVVPQQEENASVRDFLNTLRRRKAIALQAFVVVVALGATLTFMTKPLYRSVSRILVEGKASTVSLNDTTNPLTSLFVPPAGHDVVTHVEILRSPELLKKAGVEPGLVSMDVRRVGQTDVVELSATSTSRDAAQQSATALPKAYLKDIEEERISSVNSALAFARNRLKEENAKLRKAEGAMERFKTNARITSTEEEKKQAIEVAGTANMGAAAAETQASSFQARLSSLEAERRALPAFIETPTTTTNNQQIETLKDRVAALREEKVRLLFLYKPADDEVKKVDLQIAEAQKRLAQAPKDVTVKTRTPNPAIADFDAKIAETRSELRAAQATAASNRNRVAVTSAGLGRYNPIERIQTQLQRDIDVANGAVVSLGKSVEDLSLRQKAAEAAGDPIVVVTAASPAAQVAPQVMRNMIMSVLLALLLACGAAMLQESLDDHIGDEEEARRLMGTPTLGHSPLIGKEQNRLLRLPEGNIHLPEANSHLLEHFRVLRTNVQFTLMNQPRHTLLITSTLPGEGKSTTAANLAFAMAMDKHRVIIVDADLRRPRLHQMFGLPGQPGLTNVLMGQADLHQVLQETQVPGLRVLTAGPLPPNSAELLNSPAMDKVLRVLKEEADMVIFDCSPCLVTADAQVLSAKVDGVLYVMELGKVPKSAAQRSFELLRQANARILGTIFTKISQTGTGGYYGVGDYGDYHDQQKNGGSNGNNNGIHANGDHAQQAIVPMEENGYRNPFEDQLTNNGASDNGTTKDFAPPSQNETDSSQINSSHADR